MSELELLSQVRCFEGEQRQYRHVSKRLGCSMQLSVYLPPQAQTQKVPALYWLSGLTCNDQNFSTKAGAQRVAAELGVALVMPDTSPRGEGVPDDPEGHWDFGLGAGFYLNATQAPWSEHYQMYDYVVEELPALLQAHLPLSELQSISGHSMGGHGALVIALRNPGRYRSVSAFAPIVHPSACPWGQKAFSRYLGEDPERWKAWDSVELLRQGAELLPALIDQGLADNFLEQELRTPDWQAACQARGLEVPVRYREGYDHSYYFIASFIEEHLRFHAQHLLQ